MEESCFSSAMVKVEMILVLWVEILSASRLYC